MFFHWSEDADTFLGSSIDIIISAGDISNKWARKERQEEKGKVSQNTPNTDKAAIMSSGLF